MRISKKMDWCMAHRLAQHQGACRNLHGHQYVLEVEVEGDLTDDSSSPQRGMVTDFGVLKNLMQKHVHDLLDHACMVARHDSILMGFFQTNPDLKHVIVPFDSTAENIAQWIFEQLKSSEHALGSGVRIASLQLWETPLNCVRIER